MDPIILNSLCVTVGLAIMAIVNRALKKRSSDTDISSSHLKNASQLMDEITRLKEGYQNESKELRTKLEQVKDALDKSIDANRVVVDNFHSSEMNRILLEKEKSREFKQMSNEIRELKNQVQKLVKEKEDGANKLKTWQEDNSRLLRINKDHIKRIADQFTEIESLEEKLHVAKHKITELDGMVNNVIKIDTDAPDKSHNK